MLASFVLPPAVTCTRSPTARANCIGWYASNRLASSVAADLLPNDQARSFIVTRSILMELKQVARFILGWVRFLGVGQMHRNPALDDAFLAELALCLQIRHESPL